MLEERPTSASGDKLETSDALQLLQSGQLVNLAMGPHATPGRVIDRDGISLVAAQVAADLGRALGVPTELIMDGRQGLEVETSAAEVLVAHPERGDIVLGLDQVVDGIDVGFPAVIDFTDVTGTYYVAGKVTEIRPDTRPRISVRAGHASLVQLRRFVRVPVLISPDAIEVQSAPGQWRNVRGEIVDVSLGGLGLLVAEPLLSEGHIRVEFELPGRFGVLRVGGRVVPPPGPAEAATSGRRGAGLAHRRGVSFDPLGIDDLRRLQRALYHRQVELRRLAEPALGRRRYPEGRDSSQDRSPRWMFWKRPYR